MKFQIPDKLKSRKFQAFLAVLFGSLGAYFGADLSIEATIGAVLVAASIYMRAEASVDVARANGK